MELLSAGDHVEDVELLRLVTLSALVASITPVSHTASAQDASRSASSISISAGRHALAGGDAVCDLTLPVKAGAGVAVGAGRGQPVEAIAAVRTVAI